MLLSETCHDNRVVRFANVKVNKLQTALLPLVLNSSTRKYVCPVGLSLFHSNPMYLFEENIDTLYGYEVANNCFGRFQRVISEIT